MTNEAAYRATIPVLVDGKEDAELTALISKEATRLVNLATARERKATVERIRAALEGLGGWRDPRYSGMFESKGLIGRADALAILDKEAADLSPKKEEPGQNYNGKEWCCDEGNPCQAHNDD